MVGARGGEPHSCADGRERRREFLDGLRPAQTPKFSGTFAFGWQEGGKGAQLVVRRVGGQFDDDLNTDLLKAATTVDAFASWPLTGGCSSSRAAENLDQCAGHGRNQR